MFVFCEHLFCIGLVIQQSCQFIGEAADGELISEEFADNLLVCDEVDEREMGDGEEEGSHPTEESDEE
jgi:hypothetical protein